METYKTTEGQSIYDLAVELYGDEAAAVLILKDNPSIGSLDAEIRNNTAIKFTAENTDLRRYFVSKKLTVATNDPGTAGTGTGRGFGAGFGNGFK